MSGTGKRRQAQSDFRYSVGPARVPWHTVGERFRGQDVLEVVRFLLPPGEDRRAYRAALAGASRAVRALCLAAGSNAPTPTHLLEMAYRAAERMAGRVGTAVERGPTPADVRAAGEEFGRLARWCQAAAPAA